MTEKKNVFTSDRDQWLVRLAPVVGAWVAVSQLFGFGHAVVVAGGLVAAAAVLRAGRRRCRPSPVEVTRTYLALSCRGLPRIVRERVCGACGAVRARETSGRP